MKYDKQPATCALAGVELMFISETTRLDTYREIETIPLIRGFYVPKVQPG